MSSSPPALECFGSSACICHQLAALPSDAVPADLRVFGIITGEFTNEPRLFRALVRIGALVAESSFCASVTDITIPIRCDQKTINISYDEPRLAETKGNVVRLFGPRIEHDGSISPAPQSAPKIWPDAQVYRILKGTGKPSDVAAKLSGLARSMPSTYASAASPTTKARSASPSSTASASSAASTPTPLPHNPFLAALEGKSDVPIPLGLYTREEPSGSDKDTESEGIDWTLVDVEGAAQEAGPMQGPMLFHEACPWLTTLRRLGISLWLADGHDTYMRRCLKSSMPRARALAHADNKYEAGVTTSRENASVLVSHLSTTDDDPRAARIFLAEESARRKEDGAKGVAVGPEWLTHCLSTGRFVCPLAYELIPTDEYLL